MSWRRGSGCVPIYNLTEDAATAEIFDHMMTSPDFAEFLTLLAYDYID